MKKLLTICLMLLGAVAQAQNFAITATTEAAIRKNIVKGNAANYGFGMINDTLKLVGLTTRNVIFTGSTSKTDIGLGNVDNTSDANKPVSTATQTALNLKQNQLNGTGFVKASGTTISYDNSTYLSTSSAASTYLPISNPTATGTLTAPTISNSLGANFATTSGNVGVGTASPSTLLHLKNTTGNEQISIDDNTVRSTIQQSSLMFINAGVNLVGGTSIAFRRGSSYAESMRIFANGRVGINTTTDAGYLLDVNGTSIVRGTARFQSPSQAGYSELSSNSTGAIYQTNGHSYFYTNASAYDVYFQKYNSTGTNMIIKDSGSIGIGTGTPNASSILDITSTTKGVLFPRMTTTEISAISSPADGLTVYNTTLKAICFYDAGAAVWKRVSHSNM